MGHEIVTGIHDGRSCGPINTIALLKREEEQALLGIPPAHRRPIQGLEETETPVVLTSPMG